MHKEFNLTALYTDLYQLTMGQVHYLNKDHDHPAVFDYFFRKLPYGGGYVVFAGLQDLLQILQELRFSKEDIQYLKDIGLNRAYADHLADFKFNGSIYAVAEGDVVFPQVPILRVEGTMLEAQLIETLLLNMLNFQSLIATKAARIKQVVGDKLLLDFGLRRAQGLGGYHATRAAFIGGFQSTSNVKAAMDFDIPVSGTMAHAFVQQYEDELSAFRSFAEGRPDQCVLLVDTYNTLKSGVPNAIIVGKEMELRGHRLQGIRLDSGDLAYLSKHSRKMLDEAGLDYVKISVSNQLDEYVIKSLIEQEAPIDIYGVGTNLVTGQPDAALDGVYKLSLADNKPSIKLSESLSKTTLPHRKQVYRVLDERGDFWGADAIALENETNVERMHHPFEPDKSLSFKGLRLEPLLKKVFSDGRIFNPDKSLSDISKFSQQRLLQLPKEYKRFEYPHTYKVGITSELKKLRDQLRSLHLDKL
jgi:nicotinate phosphoribosyltransferase